MCATFVFYTVTRWMFYEDEERMRIVCTCLLLLCVNTEAPQSTLQAIQIHLAFSFGHCQKKFNSSTPIFLALSSTSTVHHFYLSRDRWLECHQDATVSGKKMFVYIS